MHRLRTRLVQRLVAVILMVGLGAAWAPTAAADTAGQMDARAAHAALEIAAMASTWDAAAEAFALAYVANGGAESDAARVFQSLVADGVGAPDPLLAHVVPGRLAAPAPPARSLAVPPTADRPSAVRTVSGLVPDFVRTVQTQPRRAAAQPRAP